MRLYLLYYMIILCCQDMAEGRAAGEGQEWMRFGELSLSWETGVYL
ncbi:hypothetical protein HNQ56_000945 [Anaerotaenia torta]